MCFCLLYNLFLNEHLVKKDHFHLQECVALSRLNIPVDSLDFIVEIRSTKGIIQQWTSLNLSFVFKQFAEILIQSAYLSLQCIDWKVDQLLLPVVNVTSNCFSSSVQRTCLFRSYLPKTWEWLIIEVYKFKLKIIPSIAQLENH